MPNADKSLNLTRRRLLKWSGLAGMGSVWPMWPGNGVAGPQVKSELPGFGRAKSVIFIVASGGQSQLEMWDPKPLAPVEVRGDFSAIRTSIPGVYFGEHMPRLAQLADRFCVVRNMSHEDLDHGSAFYLTMTGRYHRRRSANPLPAPEDLPCHGAILQRVRPTSQFVQSSLHLNGPAEVPLIIGPGQFGGFLGKGYDPLTLGDVSQGEIAIPSLEPQPEAPVQRLQTRQQLLDQMEQGAPVLKGERHVLDMQTLYHQAFQMLDRPETRFAFDLSRESEETRNRYGRGRAGQACLLARRLVEAGVPLITVFWSHNNRGQDVDPTNPDFYGWDTHNDIFSSLKDVLLPRYDLGISALIEDLDGRGLLDETLVVCLGEFGRAPLVALEKNFAGASPGRKHWGWVYSIMLAGAGVKRGHVVGESDPNGAYPAITPYGPWDVTATLFHALGIDPHMHYTDHQGRPYRISDGQVMEPIYG